MIKSNKPMTRRKFMQYAALAVGGGVVGFGASYVINYESTPAQLPARDPLPPGELSPEVSQNLQALVDAFVGENSGSISHYAPVFDFRARYLPDYRETYTLLSETLDLAAQDIAGQPYRDAPRDVREAILYDGLGVVSPESTRFSITPAQDTPADDLWLRFNQQVIGEILNVYMETNAMILLGYDRWPGQPRGLDAYMLPPVNS